MNQTARTTSSADFAAQLATIHGVDQFALVRNDGRLVTHNLPDPEEFADLVTDCGRTALGLGRPLGVSHLKQIVYARPHSQNIIIFQLFKYFLGIRQTCDSETETVILEVSQLLRDVARSRAH